MRWRRRIIEAVAMQRMFPQLWYFIMPEENYEAHVVMASVT